MHLQMLLGVGIIVSSTSKWASVSVLARKKYGGIIYLA